jgi:hypothetical protein
MTPPPASRSSRAPGLQAGLAQPHREAPAAYRVVEWAAGAVPLANLRGRVRQSTRTTPSGHPCRGGPLEGGEDWGVFQSV